MNHCQSTDFYFNTNKHAHTAVITKMRQFYGILVIKL